MIVRTARSKSDYEAVAALMRAFVEWHGERHAADRHIVESYFDPVAFSEELANLPGKFAEPRGRLLVAEEDGRIAGCVALRDLGNGACEMKRMFVYPEFHGRGVGQLLAGRSSARPRRPAIARCCSTQVRRSVKPKRYIASSDSGTLSLIMNSRLSCGTGLYSWSST